MEWKWRLVTLTVTRDSECLDDVAIVFSQSITRPAPYCGYLSARRGEERVKENVRDGKVFAISRFRAVLPLNLCGKHIASDPQLLHRIQYLVSIQTIPCPCKWPVFWQFVCNTVYPADVKNGMKHPNEQRNEDARHYHYVWTIQVSTHKQKCSNIIGQLCSNFWLIEQIKVLRQFAYKIVHRFVHSIPIQFIYTSCETPRNQFNCE